MNDRSTYVRKIASGQYEYGFIVRSKNFRKCSDIYTPVGALDCLSDAVKAAEVLQ